MSIPCITETSRKLIEGKMNGSLASLLANYI